MTSVTPRHNPIVSHPNHPPLPQIDYGAVDGLTLPALDKSVADAKVYFSNEGGKVILVVDFYIKAAKLKKFQEKSVTAVGAGLYYPSGTSAVDWNKAGTQNSGYKVLTLANTPTGRKHIQINMELPQRQAAEVNGVVPFVALRMADKTVRVPIPAAWEY